MKPFPYRHAIKLLRIVRAIGTEDRSTLIRFPPMDQDSALAHEWHNPIRFAKGLGLFA